MVLSFLNGFKDHKMDLIDVLVIGGGINGTGIARDLHDLAVQGKPAARNPIGETADRRSKSRMK